MSNAVNSDSESQINVILLFPSELDLLGWICCGHKVNED